jgi:predicted Zn-dependent protease
VKKLPVPMNAALALSCMALVAQESPKQLFLRARELQQVNGGSDPTGAVALYKKVSAAMPDSAEAQLRLSEALLEARDIDGALDAAKKAARLAPKNAEAAANLAIIEFTIARTRRQGSIDAKTALLNATKLLPTDAELWFRLADICESDQDRSGALNAWLHFGRLRPSMTLGDQPAFEVAYEQAAYQAFALNDYSGRREACMALAKEDGAPEKYMQWLEELAHLQVERGYLGHAEESFTLLAKKFPVESSVWQNIAIVQIQSEHFDEAAQNLKRALAIAPDPAITTQLAYCLMNVGKLQEASNLLQELLDSKGKPKSGGQLDQAKGLLGSCLLMLNRPNDLLQWTNSFGKASGNALLMGQQAHAMIQINDLKSARALIKKGMRLFPDALFFNLAATIPNEIFDGGGKWESESAKAFRLLNLKAMAYLWAEFRQWDKCLQAILEASEVSQINDVELLLLQSNALASLNQKPQALDALRACHRLAPNHPVVQNNLGYHLLENGGEIQEAAALIKTALDQEPDNASYMDSWGWALFKQGKYGEAEAMLKKAIEADPLNPEILSHLGEVFISLGRPSDALEQWEKALAFAFPDRAALNAKANLLRTELAKKALKENDEGQDLAPSDDDNDDDIGGWRP